MYGQPEAKKQKVKTEELGQSFNKIEDKSEDDWEEVDKSEGGPIEKLDDEPVEVDQGPSAADVLSVQSSGIIDTDESQSRENFLQKDW